MRQQFCPARLFLPCTLVATLAIALTFAACGTNETEVANRETRHVSTGESPVEGDWVVIHSLSDPETLNRVTQSDATAQELSTYMYETLIQVHPVTLEEVPWIAKSLPEVSEDKLSYEFELRKDVYFSDGEQVTAEDFIYYLKTIKNPRILKAAPQRVYYSRVDSAMMVDGDPFRLRVVMNEPYYLGQQWAGNLYALPKHVWDPEGLSDTYSFKLLNSGDTTFTPAVTKQADFVSDVKKNFDKNFIVGSGPYVLHKFVDEQRVELARNDNYWNSSDSLGRNYPSRIVYLTINDVNGALSALKAGELDFVPRLDQVQYKFEKDRFPKNDIKPLEYSYPAYNYVGYNMDNDEKPFFKDVRVRNAFAHALDREEMIQKIFFGNAKTIQSPIYVGRPEYDTTIDKIPFDLDKSRELLNQAGWKDSDGDGIRDKMVDGRKVDMTFTLMLNSGNNSRKYMAELFRETLDKVGVQATVATLEWSVFLERLDGHKYDACIAGWAQPVTEGDMYQLWHSESSVIGGSNYVSFKNDRVDELIEGIRSEFDYEKRVPMYKEIQSIIHEQQPYNFLVAEERVAGIHERFRNVYFFAPRPCYNAGWWWVPKDEQRYSTGPTGRNVVQK